MVLFLTRPVGYALTLNALKRIREMTLRRNHFPGTTSDTFRMKHYIGERPRGGTWTRASPDLPCKPEIRKPPWNNCPQSGHLLCPLFTRRYRVANPVVLATASQLIIASNITRRVINYPFVLYAKYITCFLDGVFVSYNCVCIPPSSERWPAIGRSGTTAYSEVFIIIKKNPCHSYISTHS